MEGTSITLEVMSSGAINPGHDSVIVRMQRKAPTNTEENPEISSNQKQQPQLHRSNNNDTNNATGSSNTGSRLALSGRGLTASTSGESETCGIGVSLRREPSGRVLVAEVKRGGPAWGTSLQVGDMLLQVDDADVTGLSANELASLIRGPVGSSVNLVIARASDLHVLQQGRLPHQGSALESHRIRVQRAVVVPPLDTAAVAIGGADSVAAFDHHQQRQQLHQAPPPPQQQQQQQQVPRRCGIGVTLEHLLDGRMIIAAVAPTGPAAGTLHEGDIVLRVNGVPTVHMSVEQVRPYVCMF